MPSPALLLQAFQELPFSAWSAVGFYAGALLFLVPATRHRVRNLFSPLAQSSKVHLGPLDALRGLLALWVAVGHLCMWSGGRFDSVRGTFRFLDVSGHAVSFFAVLSGMLIYMSIQRLDNAQGVHKYLLRRVLRIYPLYFATTVLSLFVCTEKISLHRVLAELFMFRAVGYPEYLNPPTWSLYVEVAFYLMVPVLVMACRPRLRQICFFALAVLLLGERSGMREMLLWKFFFVGILCAEYLEPARARLQGWRFAPVMLTGLALVCYAVYSDLHPNSGLLGFTERQGALVLGIPCIIFSLCSLGENWARPLNTALFRVPGVCSYSLYLLHPFLIMADHSFRFTGKGGWTGTDPVLSSIPADQVLLAVMIPAFLFWSALSYLVIERPFLTLRPKG